MKRTLSVVVFSLVLASTLVAQNRRPPLSIGENVRFAAVDPLSSDPVSTLHCEARVTRLFVDTIVVRPYGRCAVQSPNLKRVHDLHVERSRGSRPAHVLLGAFLGALGGGVAGGVIAGDGCRIEGCNGDYAVMMMTLAGAVGGGVVGAVVGFFLPTGAHWVPRPGFTVRLETP